MREGWWKVMTVCIRRDGREVRKEAEQLDGKTYTFRYGWKFEPDEQYAGEEAWLPDDPKYPIDAPQWIASGDLKPAFLSAAPHPEEG